MKLKELIAHLIKVEKEVGDVTVFVNGEYGSNDAFLMSPEEVSVSSPEMILDEDICEHYVKIGEVKADDTIIVLGG